MIAYIEQALHKKWHLVIVKAPCNGPEYIAAERIPFNNKVEARAYCKARNIRPHNF